MKDALDKRKKSVSYLTERVEMKVLNTKLEL